MPGAAKIIPETLVYELVDGKPVYYQGYRAFLSGKNKTAEPMGSSLLQSIIITNLVVWLHSKLGKRYHVFTNELGLLMPGGNRRAVDIAIYLKSSLPASAFDNKYATIPPKVIIEIDTKAELSEIRDTFTYYNQKTEQLLTFGVEKVIWIFTESRKVMVAEKDKPWQLHDWEAPIQVWESVTFSVADIAGQGA